MFPRKQKEIMRFLHENNVGICELVETKLKAKNTGNLLNNMFSLWSFTTNFNTELGGRILVAWDPNVFEVNVKLIIEQRIHTVLFHVPTRKSWFCYVVYGFNQPGDKLKLWSDLCCLGDGIKEPWIVAGDFIS